MLVEGDDFNEPISDAVRSILDGHVTLSRRLAARNQYPAIDVLDSISRLMYDVCPSEDMELAAAVRQIMSVYTEAEDLINIGAYVKGTSESIDNAIDRIDAINESFRQGIHEIADHQEARAALHTAALGALSSS